MGFKLGMEARRVDNNSHVAASAIAEPRRAKLDDMPTLLLLGREFHDEVEPPWPWCEEAFSTLVSSHIANGFVSVTEGGFLVGMMSPWPLNASWIVAHELLWWAKDGTGAAHFQMFRKWAALADEIKWSCRSDDERMKAFYERLGPQIETYYSEVRKCVSQQ